MHGGSHPSGVSSSAGGDVVEKDEKRGTDADAAVLFGLLDEAQSAAQPVLSDFHVGPEPLLSSVMHHNFVGDYRPLSSYVPVFSRHAPARP